MTMEAKSSKCRSKDIASHHCDGWVRKEQPKALLICTCPCHEKDHRPYDMTIEERKKHNDEMMELARKHAWQGHGHNYRR